MKRVRFYELAGIVSLVLHLLGSASEKPKLSPRERAQVPPPRLKYRVITNEQEIAEIRMRYATNAPSLNPKPSSLNTQKGNKRWHHPGR
jgi:hypothetical protein